MQICMAMEFGLFEAKLRNFRNFHHFVAKSCSLVGSYTFQYINRQEEANTGKSKRRQLPPPAFMWLRLCPPPYFGQVYASDLSHRALTILRSLRISYVS